MKFKKLSNIIKIILYGEKMKKIIGLIVASLLISAVFAEPVNVGGVRLLNLRGKDSAKRADLVYERLSNLLGQAIKAEDVSVNVIKGTYAVKVKDSVLVSVTSADSRVNKTSPKKLAEIWAKNLEKTLPEVCAVGK
jgi:hypothetical protein